MSTRTTGREGQQQALSSMLQPGPGCLRAAGTKIIESMGRTSRSEAPPAGKRPRPPGGIPPNLGPWSLAGHRMLPCNESVAPEGRSAMNVTDQLEDHQARCLPHMLTLRMLARFTPEAPLPWLAVAEVTQATKAILAEV